MTTMPPGSTPVTWKVTSQTEGYDSTPGSVPVKGVTIGLLVNGNITTSAFLPAADYGQPSGLAMLNSAAQKAATVAGWNHTST